MTRLASLPLALLAVTLALPAAGHEWAGLGDSRFGAVEAVVPEDWRDAELTGASPPTLGQAAHDLARFQDELAGRLPTHHPGLSAAGVATELGVQDFDLYRRRWTDALGAAALGTAGLHIAAPSAAHLISLGPWTYRRTAGVSASLDF